jgi:ABC-2 type transport system ATP-binding protein
VAALASNVDLLIMDEPTSGLDPLMEATFQYAIGEEREQGRTVLLSSHILAEVEALCDKVSIIRDGRNVETGTLSEMRHLTRTSIIAELAGPPNGLANSDQVHDLKIDGNRVRFDVETHALDHVLRQLTQVGVRSLTSQPPTLEELFLRHYTAESAEPKHAAVAK